MTKLASHYSRVTGLQLDPDGPALQENFYPIPFEKYITIQTGSGQAAKCYDLWPEVINLLRPMLNANRIVVVHLGAKDDPPLAGVYDLRGKSSVAQSNFIIKRSLLHMGNDSWLAHCAGWNKRPLVALYGSTSSWNHGPYWFDEKKTILIDAHRWGGKPTYSQNEQPKSINTIDPFLVASEICNLLGMPDRFSEQSRFWGMLYQHTLLDWVPDGVLSGEFLPELPVTVRMDIHYDEQNLITALQTGRRVNIITQRVINPGIISAFKAQILSYNHELFPPQVPAIEAPTPEYVTTIKSLCPRSIFFTRERDVGKLAALRIPYFPDICEVEQITDTTKSDYLAATLHYLNRSDTPQNRLDLESELPYTRFRSTRFILSGGLVFLTHAHRVAQKSITSLNDNTAEIIDSDLFWRDVNHYCIWYEPNLRPQS